jgi:hypothetical protein
MIDPATSWFEGETSRLTQEREIQVQTSYIQDAPSRFFLAPRVAQVKEAKGFFPTSYIQGHVRGSR